MDEIYLKKGFAFNPSSNDVTSYVDHGEHGRKPNAANHALVYMIRSIYGDWKMPVAYYFTGGDTKAPELTCMIKELHSTGLRIRALVCDAANNNISMFRRLGSTLQMPYFEVDGQRIYTIVDPPHLLNAVRNTLLKYIFFSTARRLSGRTFWTSPKRMPPLQRSSHQLTSNSRLTTIRCVCAPQCRR